MSAPLPLPRAPPQTAILQLFAHSFLPVISVFCLFDKYLPCPTALQTPPAPFPRHSKVLANSVGARTTPSFVAFTPAGRVVGQPAKDQAAMNPANTLYDIKRIIGRPWDDAVVREEVKRFPFRVVDGGDDRPLVEVSWRGDARRLTPEEVSAMVLTEMKRSAEVSVPAGPRTLLASVLAP